MAMFFGSIVAIIGTALCSGAVEGKFERGFWFAFLTYDKLVCLSQAGCCWELVVSSLVPLDR
jgi:hypothetical protein